MQKCLYFLVFILYFTDYLCLISQKIIIIKILEDVILLTKDYQQTINQSRSMYMIIKSQIYQNHGPIPIEESLYFTFANCLL